MRVIIAESCEGHGRCVQLCPAVFDLDDEDDMAVVLVDDVPEGEQDAVRRAVDSCPEAAISLS